MPAGGPPQHVHRRMALMTCVRCSREIARRTQRKGVCDEGVQRGESGISTLLRIWHFNIQLTQLATLSALTSKTLARHFHSDERLTVGEVRWLDIGFKPRSHQLGATPVDYCAFTPAKSMKGKMFLPPIHLL